MSTISQPIGGQAASPASDAFRSEPADLFRSGQFRQILRERHLEWTNLPEETRIRHTYLKKHDLSETGLDLLSPQDRAAHEAKIAELTKQPLLSAAMEQALDRTDLDKPVPSLKVVLELSETTEDSRADDKKADISGI